MLRLFALAQKRSVLVAIVLPLVSFLAVACGGGSDPASPPATSTNGSTETPSTSPPGTTTRLVMVEAGGTSGESIEYGYIQPFTADTGIEVIRQSPTEFGKLKAMVESGNVTADIFELGGQDAFRAAAEGLLEPLDFSVIDVSDLLEEGYTDYLIAYQYYSTVLAYDPDAFPDGKVPQSWHDFWNVEEFPGPRALRDLPVDNLEIALLVDGVSPEELYPLDMDRAFASLDKIKPHITAWWSTGAQPVQLLVDGEVAMTSVWNGRIQDVMEEEGLAFTWNQGILKISYFGIPKGAKHKDEAMQFLNYVTKAENQARAAEIISYTGPNPNMFDYLPSDSLHRYPTAPENYAVQVVQRGEWWMEHGEEAMRRWNEWKLQ